MIINHFFFNRSFWSQDLFFRKFDRSAFFAFWYQDDARNIRTGSWEPQIAGNEKFWIFKALKWLFQHISWIISQLFQRQVCLKTGGKYAILSKTWHFFITNIRNIHLSNYQWNIRVINEKKNIRRKLHVPTTEQEVD